VSWRQHCGVRCRMIMHIAAVDNDVAQQVEC
jgi:hypothetical protein